MSEHEALRLLLGYFLGISLSSAMTHLVLVGASWHIKLEFDGDHHPMRVAHTSTIPLGCGCAFNLLSPLGRRVVVAA